LNNLHDYFLTEGRELPLMEEFYSLQGEGHNTGQAAYFIRIGGCDVGCHWCDVKEAWNAGIFSPVPVDQIIQQAASYAAKAIVVTGGEPLMYNLDYLCQGLKKEGIRCFLETSGSHPMSGQWDWVCLSPKKDGPPDSSIFPQADELKMIIYEQEDFSWAEENAGKVNKNCLLFLQPEWSRMKQMIPLMVNYIKEHPKWRISLQSHKFMHIP